MKGFNVKEELIWIDLLRVGKIEKRNFFLDFVCSNSHKNSIKILVSVNKCFAY